MLEFNGFPVRADRDSKHHVFGLPTLKKLEVKTRILDGHRH